jgi:hypothetical protein
VENLIPYAAKSAAIGILQIRISAALLRAAGKPETCRYDPGGVAALIHRLIALTPPA